MGGDVAADTQHRESLLCGKGGRSMQRGRRKVRRHDVFVEGRSQCMARRRTGASCTSSWSAVYSGYVKVEQ